MLALLSGLGTGLALIVAIGAQNTYLLRLAVGAGARVVTAAVVVCTVSDAVLIVAGVLGVGAVVERLPAAVVVIRLLGAAFLLTYGVLAARRALRPADTAMRVDPVPAATLGPTVRAPAAPGAGIAPADGRRAPTHPGAVPARGRGATVSANDREVTVRAAVLTMLVFTWANPHVYLDTLVFLGSVANQQGPADRWWWTTGAVTASCLWFGALGFGGRLLRPLFARPGTWRVFDALVALVMLTFGVLLLLGA